MEDTQSEIRTHLLRIKAIVEACELGLLDEPVSPELALGMRQQIEGATRRIQIVRDWLDHKI